MTPSRVSRAPLSRALLNRALLNRALRRAHLWLGIGIGLQIGLWLMSGLFMTVFPIDQVRGTHLRAHVPAPTLSNISVMDPAQVAQNLDAPIQSITLTSRDGAAVYIVSSTDESVAPQIFNAATGEALSTLSDAAARRTAKAHYGGRGTLSTATYFADKAPHEYGRDGPVWRVNFAKPDAASFYIDAQTAEVKAVRTGLWRTFDFMWGLHIMDWKDRDNFNSWWIKTVAALAVLFFITGVGLAVLRLRSTLTRRRRRQHLRAKSG